MPSVEDVVGRGAAGGVLSEEDVESSVAEGLESLKLAGRRVLVLVPDGTRTMPLPHFFRLLAKHLVPQARAVDFLVALGTHAALSEEGLMSLFGLTPEERTRYANVRFLNHAWDDPRTLAEIGTIPSDEVRALSGGRLRQQVPVRLNRLVLEYDHLLVCGPVFPHEVAGFSGGNKYFFPGIAGADVIDFTHWLGALITTHDVIGRMDTPVRQAIDRAAAMIPVPRSAICAVVVEEGIAGVFVGPTETAWRQAASLSAERHVIWRDQPVRQVLAVLPPMYGELWVGAKGMYKTEPVVADGGEVILYAPHLRSISAAHGAILGQIGYHVRDYFVAQWARFRHLPWSVLAHSTHLKGAGAYSNGVEWPRIRVTLATGLSAQECRALNLDYRDPRSLDPQSFAGREKEGILYVPKAGEYLYRLRERQIR
jgi:nickel-dependent lactate racemase